MNSIMLCYTNKVTLNGVTLIYEITLFCKVKTIMLHYTNGILLYYTDSYLTKIMLHYGN